MRLTIQILIAIATLLSGCADPQQKQQFDLGITKLNSGDNVGAYKEFFACASQGNPSCMDNAGAAAARSGQKDLAQRWWTLSARYGDTWAISKLTQLGLPVPAPDLRQSQAKQDEGFWKGFADGLEKANQDNKSNNRTFNTNCTTYGSTTNCISY